MANDRGLERFQGFKHVHPKFYDWVRSHREVIEDFRPSRWRSQKWAERVDEWWITQIFERPMPDDYFRFLFAYCHAAVWKDRLNFGDDLPLDPVEALQLVDGEVPTRIRIHRYRNQPASFYPFASMGVDGVSYNFWFLDEERYVVAYHSPMDHEHPVPFLYPDMTTFLTDMVLGGLDDLEPSEDVRRVLEPKGIQSGFRDGTALDCTVYIAAFNLEIHSTNCDEFRASCKECVLDSLSSQERALLEGLRS